MRRITGVEALATMAALTIASLAIAPVEAETINPTVAFGVVDTNLDGAPDQFSSASLADAVFTRLKEQRSCAEFDLTGLSGGVIQSATLTGVLNEQFTFGFGTTPADFEFDFYNGNGLADLSDFSVTGTTIGSVNVDEDFDSMPFGFDVTSALQSLVDSGATHAGLRALTPLPNVGQVDVNDLTLEITAVPEPAGLALLALAGLLARRRRW